MPPGDSRCQGWAATVPLTGGVGARGHRYQADGDDALGRDVGTRLDHNGKPTQTIYGAGFILQLKPGRTLTGIVRDHLTTRGSPACGSVLGVKR